MPSATERRALFDSICIGIKYSAVFVIGVTGAAQKITPANPPVFYTSTVAFVSAWAVVIIAFAGAVGIAAELVAQRYGREWEWEFIQFQLDELQKAIASDLSIADMAGCRVTLFQHKRFALRASWNSKDVPKFRGWWAGWLVVACRAGHLKQGSRTAFYTPIQSGKGAPEGFAGEVWSSIDAICAPDLPEVRRGQDDATIQAYASRTNTPARWIKNAATKLSSNEVLPRYFWGIRIGKSSDVWGILIVDSSLPTLHDLKKMVSLCDLTCKNLAKIVIRV